VPAIAQDRMVAKEVSLGVIRAFEPPQNHIGLAQIAPFLDVQSDDVIFDYIPGFSSGMAPARAEDAESELASKDEFVGTGRASLVDWAIKDSYSASDVTRYRESLLIEQQLAGASSLPLTVTSIKEGWENKLARDARRRRKMLDNRMEWLIMQALATNAIAYNDGRIIWNVAFNRPTGQHNQAPANGVWSDAANADPIDDIASVKSMMVDTYGVNLNRAIISTRILRYFSKLQRFHNSLVGNNPMYTVNGWSDEVALRVISDQTGVEFTVYDSVYRTRPLGSQTITSNRFIPDDKVILLPSVDDVNQLDDTEIGFAKTLTAPHPEGNWSSGFYEWERETVDPWRYDVGTGIKAFPVFPHMDLTYTMDVLA
jgi:Phage major capsid protein E